MKTRGVLSAIIALWSGISAQATTIQENTVFPDMDLIASQLVDGGAIGIRDIPNPIHAVMGQSFTLTSSTTLRAITLKAFSDGGWSSGDDVVNLWIGADTDPNPTNFVAGAANLLTNFDLNGVSVTEGNYYSINLDSDLVLPAGDYAFQFSWAATGAAHQWFLCRANGTGDYENGGLISGQKEDGSVVDFPLDTTVGFGLDLVFGLHTSVIGTVASFSVTPEDVAMFFVPPNSQATGAVEAAYTSDTTMDIAISISDESHPGSFSVLSTTPQTLTTNTLLEFGFDNTVSNLVVGESATGLVTIAWSETGGGGGSGQVVIPLIASAAFAPDADNVFAPTTGTWGNPDNWSLTRVPGTQGADRGIIQVPALTCNVETNFTALFAWKTWIRTTTGPACTLNIGADFKGSQEIQVGQASAHYGVLNQTAGTVETPLVYVGDPAGTAPSNSYYNLTGGTLDLGKLEDTSKTVLQASATGVMNIDGGTLALDLTGSTKVATIAHWSSAANAGTVALSSGALSMLGGSVNTVVNQQTAFDISGGDLDIIAQFRSYNEIKVRGDDADITIGWLNSQPGTSYVFDLDETGVSTIKVNGWATLGNVGSLVVDGSAYTGGSTNINLFKPSNLAALIPSGNITVTNFPEGVSATVTQVAAPEHAVILTITVEGYPGWIAEYGLSGTNALMTANPDGDSVNNLYEYGLGGDPTNHADIGTQPVLETGASYVDYVHVRRVAASEEISYVLAITPNLQYGPWTTNTGYTIVGYGPVVDDFDTVTNRIDTTGKTAEFIKLIIEEL